MIALIPMLNLSYTKHEGEKLGLPLWKQQQQLIIVYICIFFITFSHLY